MIGSIYGLGVRGKYYPKEQDIIVPRTGRYSNQVQLPNGERSYGSSTVCATCGVTHDWLWLIEQFRPRPNFGNEVFRLAANVDRRVITGKAVRVLTGRAPGFDDLAEHVFQRRFGYSYENHHVP